MTTTSIKEESTNQIFSLSTFPNSFSNGISIVFSLDRESLVSVKILDQAGKVIDKLYQGQMKSGMQELSWNPSSEIRNGVYFGLIDLNGSMQSFKIQLSH